MLTFVPEFSDWAAARFGALGWLGWAAAVLGVAYGGACMRAWAECYAACLRQGAVPDAATLWGTTAAARRRLRLAGPDGAWAVPWGLAGGTVLALWGVAALPALVLCLGLAALAWIDAYSGLLPDALTLPLMVGGWWWGPLSVAAASSASALVWAGLAGLASGYRWLRGRDGFGAGDVKCLAAVAAWLGVEDTAVVLCQACVLGMALWGWRHSLARLRGRPRPAGDGAPRGYASGDCAPEDGAPFGPCIALAAIPAVLRVL